MSSDSNICGAETKSGDPCQRAPSDNGLCYQHGGKRQKRQKRAHKLDDIRERKILDALKSGAPYRLAAQSAGIHRDTLLQWRKKFPEFREKCIRAAAEGAVDLLDTIGDHAKDDWRAAAWILEKRYPEMFGDEESAEDVIERMDDEKRRDEIKQLLEAS